MQSAKIFAATTQPFWKETGTDGHYKMSVTLSDRITRGTSCGLFRQYGGYKGSGIFLSYTWNDDSLKFLGERGAVTDPCRTLYLVAR
jgi:tryptophan 2-monooxygenase